MERLLWLDKERDTIIRMYESGSKQIEIANYFNTSQGSISTRLRKWGVSNPDSNRFIRVDISKGVLYDLYWNKELHPRIIGELYGCSFGTIHNKLKQYSIPTRTKSEARMGKLNPIYGVGHTKKACKKMSLAFKNGRKMGYNNHWGKGAYYDTPNQGRKWMRSGWEIKTANYLTNKGVDWYYEYRWLSVGEDNHYLPDFYLPVEDKYIEVKGRKEKVDMAKVELAMKRYDIELWDGEELLKRGIINNCGITKINRKYR